MKRLKRWLALVLAVALLGANVVYSMGSELKANEIEQEQQAAQPENTGGQEQQTFTSDGVSVEVTDSGTETAEQTEEPASRQSAQLQQTPQEPEPVQPENTDPAGGENNTAD